MRVIWNGNGRFDGDLTLLHSQSVPVGSVLDLGAAVERCETELAMLGGRQGWLGYGP